MSGAVGWCTEPRTTASRGDPAARGRVLVVDDNPDVAWTCSALLESEGYDVATALDGPTALRLARIWRPQAAVLDIGLPGLDGFGLAQALRREFGDAILLVAVTGYGQDEYRGRARAAGFDHHLVKPASLDELVALLG